MSALGKGQNTRCDLFPEELGGKPGGKQTCKEAREANRSTGAPRASGVRGSDKQQIRGVIANRGFNLRFDLLSPPNLSGSAMRLCKSEI